MVCNNLYEIVLRNLEEVNLKMHDNIKHKFVKYVNHVYPVYDLEFEIFKHTGIELHISHGRLLFISNFFLNIVASDLEG